MTGAEPKRAHLFYNSTSRMRRSFDAMDLAHGTVKSIGKKAVVRATASSALTRSTVPMPTPVARAVALLPTLGRPRVLHCALARLRPAVYPLMNQGALWIYARFG